MTAQDIIALLKNATDGGGLQQMAETLVQTAGIDTCHEALEQLCGVRIGEGNPAGSSALIDACLEVNALPITTIEHTVKEMKRTKNIGGPLHGWVVQKFRIMMNGEQLTKTQYQVLQDLSIRGLKQIAYEDDL